jgi:hypothetical protein
LGWATGQTHLRKKMGTYFTKESFSTCFWGFPPSNGQNNAFFAHLSHKRGLKKVNEFALGWGALEFFANKY